MFLNGIRAVLHTLLNVLRLLFLVFLVIALIFGWGWFSEVVFGKLTTGQYLHKTYASLQKNIMDRWPGPIFGLIDRVTSLEERLNGPVRTYFGNGKLKSEVIYKKGRPDGPAKKYHSNGQIQAEGVYQEGVLNGLVKEYDEDGELVRERFFERGVPLPE